MSKFKLGQKVFAETQEYGLVKGLIWKLDAGISRDALVILDKHGSEIVLLEEQCHIHIRDEVTKMVARWRKEGFNGVRFCECYVENVNTLEDFLSDGFTKEDHDQFVKDYVVFVASPQELFNFGDDNEYTSVRFNQRKFFRDLYREMGSMLGTDIEIIHRPSCHEFEISRKKQIGV